MYVFVSFHYKTGRLNVAIIQSKYHFTDSIFSLFRNFLRKWFLFLILNIHYMQVKMFLQDRIRKFIEKTVCFAHTRFVFKAIVSISSTSTYGGQENRTTSVGLKLCKSLRNKAA